MHGSQDRPGPVRFHHLAAVLRHPERAPEQRLGSGAAEGHDQGRPHQPDFLPQPWIAGPYLAGIGLLVEPSLDQLLPHELEVLHHVGDVHVLAVEPDLDQRAIEHLARRPDERRALAIFLIAGLLADQHDARADRAPAEDGLRRVTVEIAAPATGAGVNELLQRGAGRDERAGALVLDRRTGGSRLTLALGSERLEAPHLRITRMREQIALFVDQAPEDLVEQRPALGVARVRGPARQLDGLGDRGMRRGAQHEELGGGGAQQRAGEAGGVGQRPGDVVGEHSVDPAEPPQARADDGPGESAVAALERLEALRRRQRSFERAAFVEHGDQHVGGGAAGRGGRHARL